jgi:hypothetical protein
VEEVIVAAHLRAFAMASCLSLLPSFANACSFASVMIKGSSSFKVSVLDYRERPMEGAEIVLMHGEKEEKRFKTDAHGEALIGKLAPGLYDLSLDQDVVSYFAQGYRLEVTKESQGLKELIFHWPAQNVIATDSLSGMLHSWEADPTSIGEGRFLKQIRGEGKTVPLAKAQLSLFKFLSKEKIAETTTDDAGRFDFRVSEPGLYYMQFKFESYEETVLLDLDLDFASSVSMLDVVIDDFVICGNAPGYRSLNSPT